MVNVGLVTRSPTASARHAPRTHVVFPVPSSPETVTTSPGTSRSATRPARRSVSSAPSDTRSRDTTRSGYGAAPASEEAELHGGLGRGEAREHRLLVGHLVGAAEQLREAPEVVLEDPQHRG